MGSWMSLTSLNKIRRLLVARKSCSYTKFIMAKLQKNVEILANLFQYSQRQPLTLRKNK